MLISWLFVPHPFIHSSWILTPTISKIIRGFIKSISWPLIAFWSMTQLLKWVCFVYFFCFNVHVVSLCTCSWISLSVEMMKMTLFDVLMALSLKWMKSLFKKVWLLPRLMTSFVRECMTLACPTLNGLCVYQNRWLFIKDEWLPLFKGKWSRGYWNKWPLLSRINVFRLSKSKWPPRVLKKWLLSRMNVLRLSKGKWPARVLK